MSSCPGNSLIVCGDPGRAVARVLGVLHQQAPVLGKLESSHSPHELRAARHGNSGPQPQPRPAAFPCPPPCASRSAPTSSRRTWARRSPKGRMVGSEQQPTGSPGCTQCRCGPWPRSPLSPVTRRGTCTCPQPVPTPYLYLPAGPARGAGVDTGHRQAIHGELPARARARRSGAAAAANRRRPLTHRPRAIQS